MPKTSSSEMPEPGVRLQIQEWPARSLCSQHDDPDLWFQQAVAAKMICAQCPVLDECLAYAVTMERTGCTVRGVWGGLSHIQRMRLIKDPTRVLLASMRRIRLSRTAVAC